MSKTQLHPTTASTALIKYPDDVTDNGNAATKLTSVNPCDFLTLQNRLKTFENFQNSQISSTKLAEAGFIYTGKDDIVICPFCKVEGFRWLREDNPMADHREWTPHCPFIRNNVENNENNAVDTCGLYGIEVVPNSIPGETRLERLGVQRAVSAQYPDKFSYESRFESFEKWPKAIKQRPADLAEAGFFYTGVGDQTLCFHCGGGLKDWEENDDPWEQHALWFSKCTFLNLKKGAEFIEKVKGDYERANSASASNQPEEKTKETQQATATTPSVGVEGKQLETPSSGGEGEKREPDEKTLCKICYKNELGVVFLPCGHIVACVDCAAALRTCAVCRKPLEATVRAFLS